MATKVSIDVETDLHGSPKKLDETEASLKGMRNQAEKGSTSMAGLWKQFAGGLISVAALNKLLSGAKGLIGSFMSVATETETYKLRLETLLGSQEKATKAMDFFKATAAKLPFTLQDVIESGTRLAAIKAPFEKWIPRIADLAAAMGMDLPTATDQMARAMSAGLGSADLFREKGINAMIEAFAKENYAIKDISKVALPELQKVLYDFLETQAGGAEKLSKSWTGIVSMLQDKWFQFRDAVMKSGIFEILKEGLAAFNKKLDEFIISGKFDEWAYATANAVIQSFKLIAKGIEGIIVSFYYLKGEVFKVGEVIVAMLAEMMAKVVFSLAIASKVIPGLKGITKEAALAFKDLVIVGMEYNQLASEQYDKGSDIMEVFEGIEAILNKAASANKNASDKTKGLTTDIESSTTSLGKNNKEMVNLVNKTGELTIGYDNFGKKVVSISKIAENVQDTFKERFFKPHKTEITKLGQDWEDFAKTLGPLLQILADEVGGNFGKLISSIGLALGNIKASTDKTFAGILEAIGPQVMGQIGGAIGQMVSGAKSSFASLGAAIGGAVAMIPGIGTVLGAVLPAIGGLIGGLFGKTDKAAEEAKKKAQELEQALNSAKHAASLYGTITDETAKKIAESAKTMGNAAAVAKHFADVIKDIGPTQENLNNLWKGAVDILDQYAKKKLTASDASKSLSESFDLLIKAAQEFGVEGSKAMIDFILKTKESGLEVKSMTDYIIGQLDKIPASLTTLIESYAENDQAVHDMGLVVSQTFNSMLSAGVSWIDAVNKMKDPLLALKQKYTELGTEGDATIEQLFKIIGITEANADLFKSIQANKEVMEALGNSGFMTAEAMKSLTSKASEYYRELTNAGMTSKEAYKAMSPYLQDIYNYSKAYGITLDDNTQKLIDEAIAAGAVTETQEDTKDIMKDIRDILKEMREYMKGDMKNAVDGIRGGFDGWNSSINAAAGNMTTGMGNAFNTVRNLANQAASDIQSSLGSFSTQISVAKPEMGKGWQHGGYFEVGPNRPTAFIAGEGSKREAVSIQHVDRQIPQITASLPVKIILEMDGKKIAEGLIPNLTELTRQGRLRQDIQTLVRIES